MHACTNLHPFATKQVGETTCTHTCDPAVFLHGSPVLEFAVNTTTTGKSAIS